MKKTVLLFITVCMFSANIASADTFGTGDNQFEIEFVPISGDASSANGTNISQYSPSESGYKTFSDPGEYRMGVYEITQGQWVKFENSYGPVYGNPTGAYRNDAAYGTTKNEPTNNVSWYEAVQFVNWLNTSKGYQAAYKFTGTQGTSDYSFTPWQEGDIGYNQNNPFRNSDAFYFLPTEQEWVKAAYWNGDNLQTFATIGDYQPNTVESNWGSSGYTWDVGSGIQELNGTYDMMGNMWEWMENPYSPDDYVSGAYPCMRGGSTWVDPDRISLSYRAWIYPNLTALNRGFRVAAVPEPTTISLLALGAFFAGRKRNIY